MYSTLEKSTIVGVTTSQQPRSITTEHSPGHPRVRRYAFMIGVTAVVVTLAWWLSPAVGGILTIVASGVLAAVLAPGPTDTDRHSFGRDHRNDVGWYL